MPYFKVTTAPDLGEVDTVHLRAAHLADARQQLELIMGPIPPQLLRWDEVSEAQVPRTAKGDLDLLATVPIVPATPRRRRP